MNEENNFLNKVYLYIPLTTNAQCLKGLNMHQSYGSHIEVPEYLLLFTVLYKSSFF